MRTINRLGLNIRIRRGRATQTLNLVDQLTPEKYASPPHSQINVHTNATVISFFARQSQNSQRLHQTKGIVSYTYGKHDEEGNKLEHEVSVTILSVLKIVISMKQYNMAK